MVVSAVLMRLVWAIAEEMKSQELLMLSDSAIVAALMQQVSDRMVLSSDEVCALYTYVSGRVSLIRDIADSRRSRGLTSQAPTPTLR